MFVSKNKLLLTGLLLFSYFSQGNSLTFEPTDFHKFDPLPVDPQNNSSEYYKHESVTLPRGDGSSITYSLLEGIDQHGNKIQEGRIDIHYPDDLPSPVDVEPQNTQDISDQPKNGLEHDHARDVAIDGRRSETLDQKSSDLDNDSYIRNADNQISYSNPEKIAISNNSKTTSITTTIDFSSDAVQMLKELGLHNSFKTDTLPKPTAEQNSLFSWIKHTVNRGADLYYKTTHRTIKLVIAETTMVCAAAHDLVVKGEIRKGSDLLKLGMSAVNKYDELRKIATKSYFRRVGHITRHPFEFIYDQASGIGKSLITSAKVGYFALRLRMHDPKAYEECYKAIASLPEKATYLADAVAQMSVADWNIAMDRAAHNIGETAADVAVSSVLFHYAPKAFTPITKIVSKINPADAQRLVMPAERLANAIQLVFDETKQAYFISEQLTPALVGVGEASPALPAVSTLAEGANELSQLEKVGSAVAANASKVVEQGITVTEKTIETNLTVLGIDPSIKEAEVIIKHPVVDYTRTGSALKLDPHHDFDKIIDNFARYAETFELIGGDGIKRILYQIEGSLNGIPGIFEWIADPKLDITHRLFIAEGKISGKPNIFPRK